MIQLDDIIEGQKVIILNDMYRGRTGTIVYFDYNSDDELIDDEVVVKIDGTLSKEVAFKRNDLTLYDPYSNFGKRLGFGLGTKQIKENKNKIKTNTMKNSKLVVESLDELFETKKAVSKAEEPRKMADVHGEHAKVEKSTAKKEKQSSEEKAKQAIKALTAELAKAKKPGAFKTVAAKNAKIKEIEDKIAKFEAKLK